MKPITIPINAPPEEAIAGFDASADAAQKFSVKVQSYGDAAVKNQAKQIEKLRLLAAQYEATGKAAVSGSDEAAAAAKLQADATTKLAAAQGKSAEKSTLLASAGKKSRDVMLGSVAVLAGLAYEASKAQKINNSLALALQKTGTNAKAAMPTINAWAEGQAKFGVSADAAKQGLARLTLTTGSAKVAMMAYGAALQIHAATGKNFNAVQIATAKAMEGNVSGLKRYGIMLQKGATDQEIATAIAKKFGGQAAANTTSLSQLKASLENVAISMGGVVLPIFQKLISALSTAASWLSQHKTLAIILIGALGGLATGIYLVTEAMKAWAAIQKILDIELTANPIGIVILAIAALTAAIVVAYKESATFRTLFHDVWSDAKGYVSDAVAWMQAEWQKIAPGVTKALNDVEKAWDKLEPYIKDALAVVIKVVTVAWKEIETEFKIAFALVEGMFNVFGDIIHGNWGKAWDDLKGTVSTVFSDILSFLGSIGKEFGPIGLWIGEEIAHGVLSGISALVGGIVDVMNDVIKVVVGGVNAVMSGLSSLHFTIPGFDTHIPGVGKVGATTIGIAGLGSVSAPTISNPASDLGNLVTAGAFPSLSLPSIGGSSSGSSSGSTSGSGSSAVTGGGGGGLGGAGDVSGDSATPTKAKKAKKPPAYKLPQELEAKIKLAQDNFKKDVTKQHLDTLDGLYNQEHKLLTDNKQTAKAASVTGEINSANAKYAAAVSKAQLATAKKIIAKIQSVVTDPSQQLKVDQAANAAPAVIATDQENLLAAYQTEANQLKGKLATSTGKAKAAYKTALTKVQTSIQSTSDAVVSSLQNIAQTAQQSLQTLLSQVESAADTALGNSYFQNGLQTPAEAALAAMQQKDQQDQLNKALSDAQAQAVADAASGSDAGTMQTDQDAITAAQRAIDENNLQTQATAERTQADQQYAQAQFNLNAQIEALSKNVGDGSSTMAGLQGILSQFGVNLSTLSDAGGNGLLSTLTVAINDTITAFQNMTRASGGQVTTASVTTTPSTGAALATMSKGALARAGIGSFAAGAVVSGPTIAKVGEAGTEVIAPLSSLGSLGGGGSELHVHFDGPVYADDKGIADLTDKVYSALLRKRKATGPLQLT